jgi:carbon-monoxide dehydrogenase iron sulfur subunit
MCCKEASRPGAEERKKRSASSTGGGIMSEIEYRIRNRYIKTIDEDTKKREQLDVLHIMGAPRLAYKSKVTGKMMLWYVDSEKCTGCKQCVMACSIANTMKNDPAESRIYVKKTEPLGWSIPIVCEHCVEAPCALICPVYAISRDEVSGIVSIDFEKCTGCRLCRYACPWGKETIQVREVEGLRGLKAVKCDLCGGDPACAKVCVSGALRWVELNDDGPPLKRLMSKIRAQQIAAMNAEGCL